MGRIEVALNLQIGGAVTNTVSSLPLRLHLQATTCTHQYCTTSRYITLHFWFASTDAARLSATPATQIRHSHSVLGNESNRFRPPARRWRQHSTGGNTAVDDPPPGGKLLPE